MDMGLKDKVVIVTGSSSRIGRATALAFGSEGAKVVVTYLQNRAGAEETARLVEAAGGQALLVQLDLSDEATIQAALSTLTETWGNPLVLVNNAVAWPRFPQPGERFETLPSERFQRSLTVNLYGPFRLTQALVGGMREAGWGRIVHVSTGLVEDGMAGAAPYVSAKAGLHGLTRTMSRELARDGILTNVVMPGFTRAVDESLEPRLQHLEAIAVAATATGRISRPEDAASLIVYLGSRANTHVTGEFIRADGHFIAPLVPAA